MDRGQFLKVPVGLVDGQQNFVHFVNGFVHGGLEEVAGQRDGDCLTLMAAAMLECRCAAADCESHHVEGGGRLLQEAHQTRLAEVLPGADSLLLRREDVVGHGRLLQDVGGDVLERNSDQSDEWRQHGAPPATHAALTNLEGDAADGQVATVLQHVEVLRH